MKHFFTIMNITLNYLQTNLLGQWCSENPSSILSYCFHHFWPYHLPLVYQETPGYRLDEINRLTRSYYLPFEHPSLVLYHNIGLTCSGPTSQPLPATKRALIRKCRRLFQIAPLPYHIFVKLLRVLSFSFCTSMLLIRVSHKPSESQDCSSRHLQNLDQLSPLLHEVVNVPLQTVARPNHRRFRSRNQQEVSKSPFLLIKLLCKVVVPGLRRAPFSSQKTPTSSLQKPHRLWESSINLQHSTNTCQEHIRCSMSLGKQHDLPIFYMLHQSCSVDVYLSAPLFLSKPPQQEKSRKQTPTAHLSPSRKVFLSYKPLSKQVQAITLGPQIQSR